MLAGSFVHRRDTYDEDNAVVTGYLSFLAIGAPLTICPRPVFCCDFTTIILFADCGVVRGVAATRERENALGFSEKRNSRKAPTVK
jgi:hypothetical protein